MTEQSADMMDLSELRVFVGGEWSTGRAGTCEVTDPTTEENFARVSLASERDVDDAVTAARQAVSRWAHSPISDRVTVLSRLGEALERDAPLLAHIIEREQGSPPAVARRLHVDVPIEVIRKTVEALREFRFESRIGNSLVLRESVGVVAAITPWNLPLYQVVAKVIPAIAAGCAVVLKPATETPLSAIRLARALDEAGLPRGVFNVVPGRGSVIGDYLVRHPGVDMVSFTGSTAVGRFIAEGAASTLKRVTLELGGKSASVVCSDVDDERLTYAVKNTVANCFLNAGQTCTALSRLVVPVDRLDRVEQIAETAATKYHAGGPRLGPLISADQRSSVLGYMRAALDDGARLVAGGPATEVPDRGFFVPVAVYSGVDADSSLAQEEVFGPVLSIIPYSEEAEAIEIANNSPYGLSSAVWASSETRALGLARQLQAGMVDINGGAFNPAAPFGGYKKSGYGRELGRFGIEDCLQVKAVQQ